MLSSPLLYTIISFTIIMIAIYQIKPQSIFNGDKLKEFGIGDNKALLPFPVIAILIAIITYFIFFYIDNINTKTNTNNNTNTVDIQNNTPQQYVYRIIKQTPDGRLFI